MSAKILKQGSNVDHAKRSTAEVSDADTAIEVSESNDINDDEIQLKSYKMVHNALKEPKETQVIPEEDLNQELQDKEQYSLITSGFDRLTQYHLTIAEVDEGVVYSDPSKEIYRCNLKHPKQIGQVKDIKMKEDEDIRTQFTQDFRINFHSEHCKNLFFEKYKNDILWQNKQQKKEDHSIHEDEVLNPLLDLQDLEEEEGFEETFKCNDCKNN